MKQTCLVGVSLHEQVTGDTQVLQEDHSLPTMNPAGAHADLTLGRGLDLEGRGFPYLGPHSAIGDISEQRLQPEPELTVQVLTKHHCEDASLDETSQ